MQTDIVLRALEKDGVCYSKEEYVRKKYVESAPIFTTAYSWFVKEAMRLVPRPEGAEYPYWAFKDLYNLDKSGEDNILKLSVPIEEAVLFDVRDWNRIICMKYLGKNRQEESAFEEQLAQRGMLETKVMLTNFYPDWKKQIMESWNNLFRNFEILKAGTDVTEGGIQAGLWRIKKEWITER